MTTPACGPAKSKSDVAYRHLRRAIVTSQTGANEPLDETILMTQIGVGRTPLREALKRLALEQFIVWPPHRTPYVRAMSVDDFRKLYETRFLIEVSACGLAAERIGVSELEALEEALERMQAAVASDDAYEAVEMDYEIHSAIARGTKNRFLEEAVNQLNCGSLVIWYQAHSQLGLGNAYTTHLDLVEAIRKGDRSAAEELMRQHIATSQRRQQRLHSLAVDIDEVFEASASDPRSDRKREGN